MNGCWRVLGAGLMAALLGMSVGGVLAAPAVSTIEIPVIQCDNPPVGDPQVCTPLFRPERRNRKACCGFNTRPPSPTAQM